MVNEGGRPSGASINAACRWQKNHTTGPGPGKQTNRPAGDGNAPLLSPAATSLHGKASHTILSHLRLPTNRVRLPPRRGRFTLCSAFELISITKHSVAKTSPSGESTAAGGNRGAFPTGRRPGLPVFYARRAVVWFCRRKAAYKLGEAATTTLGPLDPSNLRTLRTLGPPGPSTLTPERACPQAPSQPSEPLVLLYRIRYSKLFLLFLYFLYKTML